MQNQEEKAAKKEEQLFWRKCPICAQEFKDFLPLIKHVEEHRRRESQAVKIELGADNYLQKEIGVNSYLMLGPKPTKGCVDLRAKHRRGSLQPTRELYSSRLQIGCTKL